MAVFESRPCNGINPTSNRRMTENPTKPNDPDGCPKCAALDTSIVGKVELDGSVYRRHRCGQCRAEWRTRVAIVGALNLPLGPATNPARWRA